jgi:hypothetical protein
LKRHLAGRSSTVCIRFKSNARVSHVSISRLVAATFLRNTTEEQITKEVHHIDHNWLSNTYTNLQWLTSAQNSEYEGNCIRAINVINPKDVKMYASITLACKEFNLDNKTFKLSYIYDMKLATMKSTGQQYAFSEFFKKIYDLFASKSKSQVFCY